MILPIPLSDLAVAASGVARPEDLLATGDGQLYCSDSAAAVSEILPDGSLRRVGKAGGEPTGINLLADGSVAIGNFSAGILQRLDLATGVVETIADQVDGLAPGAVNYPLPGAGGVVFVSCSARQDPALSMATGAEDGYVFRLDPDGSTTIVADHLAFPNCMTFDSDGTHLYVVRSTTSDVVRFAVSPDGNLGPAQRYGPPLGGRRPDEFGPESLAAFGQPDVLARWALADGCGFDEEGNLWVTLMSANRVVVITPQLDVVTVIDDPEGRVLSSPSSLLWTGADRRDLYIGSLFSDRVIRTCSSVPGMPAPYPR